MGGGARPVRVAVVRVEGGTEATGRADHRRGGAGGDPMAQAADRCALGRVHGRSRIPVGGCVGPAGNAAGRLVPAVRVGLGLEVAAGAGGRRGSAIELVGARHPMAGLAIEDVSLRHHPVEGGIRGPDTLGIRPGRPNRMRRRAWSVGMTAGGGMFRVAEAGAVAARGSGQGRGAGLGDRVADHAGSIRIQGVRGIPV